MLSVWAGNNVKATEPNETLKTVLAVEVIDLIVVTFDGTTRAFDGGAAKLDVAAAAFDSAD